MSKKTLVSAALLLMSAVYFFDKRRISGAGVFDDLANSVVAVSDYVQGELMVSNSRMSDVDKSLVNNPNVIAFLRVIRRGEGTSDVMGYSRLFGGSQFSGFADHPRTPVKWNKKFTTAAGAYQFLSSTWDETRKAMGLGDFSPQNQDVAALGRIAYRGALGDVIAGNFESAIRKCASEWASLPGAPYGQPVISMDIAKATFLNAGGVIA